VRTANFWELIFFRPRFQVVSFHPTKR